MSKTIIPRKVQAIDSITGQYQTFDTMEVNNGNIDVDILTRHLSVNGENAVTKIGNAALSYIRHKDEFIYGGNGATRNVVEPIDGKWGISCSVFAFLIIYGITYENSAYKRGAGNNILDPDCCTDLDMWEWFTTEWPDKTGDFRFKYAYDLAKWCNERGYCFKPNADLSNIKPGDVLFMKNQINPENSVPNTYMDIDHVAVFAYWKNDNMYKVWEVGSLPDDASYYKTNLEDNCVLVARVPYANHEEPFENLALSKGAHIGTTQINYIENKVSLKPNHYYTFVCELTFDKNITDYYPAIFNLDTRIGMYDGASEKPTDNIYVIPFIPVVESTTINFRMLRNPEIDSSIITNWRIAWFQVHEGLHFTKKQNAYGDRQLLINYNNGFTQIARNLSDNLFTVGFNGTFETGITNIGTISQAIYHGVYNAIISCCVVNGSIISGVQAVLHWPTTIQCILEVHNATDAAITGDVYCTIPIFTR